jgi:hypothetical protein
MNNTEQQVLIETIRAEAEAKHAQYPQYKGHWDGWFLIRMTRRVRSKLGVAFEKGEIALAKEDDFPDGPRQMFVAYSRRNNVDTLIGFDKAKRV